MAQKIEPLGSPFFSSYIMAGYEAMARPVPETTPTRYLSGMITLCLPSPWTDYTPGQSSAPDCLYCFVDAPQPLPTWGEEAELAKNTMPIYGNYGIHNYSEILTNYGFEHNHDIVYGADHYRALIDIIFYEISIKDLDFSREQGFFSNWLLVESIGDLKDCTELLEKIAIMKHFLSKERAELLELFLKREIQNLKHGGPC